MQNNTVRIASFDIGIKNFAFSIEEYDLTQLLQIENVPKTFRYKNDGTITKEFNNLLTELYKKGKTILLDFKTAK